MTTSTRPVTFLSLRWKSSLAVLFLLIFSLGITGWYHLQQFNVQLAELLTSQQTDHQSLLENDIQRTGTALRDQLKTATAGQDLRAFFTATLEQLQRDWGVSQVLLYDSNNQQQISLPSNTSATALKLPASLSINELAAVSLQCFSSCAQLITLRQSSDDSYLVVVRPMQYFIDRWEKRNHQLALIRFAPQTGESLNIWQAGVITAPLPAPERDALLAAQIKYQPVALTGNAAPVVTGDGAFAVGMYPVPGFDQLTVLYLVVDNITNDYLKLRIQAVNAALPAIVVAVGFALFFWLCAWYQQDRLIAIKTALLAIGDKQFGQAREVLGRYKQRSMFRDENHSIYDTANDLSYQMESLEKAVSLRTREMERLSLFDELSGLANRTLFQYELQTDIQRHDKDGGVLAVAILDLDKFKRINDSIGHQMGDQLLAKVGVRLKNATRSLGLVARLGGDEFAIILRSAKKVEQIGLLCKKIIELVHKPIELETQQVIVSCSLGVSIAMPGQTTTDMIRNAEIAMYNAKDAGGNEYRVYSTNMASQSHASLSLEVEIRRAFDKREFTLYLQPKVNMDRQVEGFEALIRWDHPERGIVPPVEFIPAMEEMRIISELDNFVLEASCRQLKVLQAHYPDISIAVNISSTHFTDHAFIAFLTECLEKYPIDPSRLELEITETLLMENMSVGMQIIQEIKKLGVSIAIDDFGTGYSSLSYLKKLPVDTIKIDREFIKDIPDSESDMQISSVIIFLAKQLNFKVVAEGVETSEQLVFLKANQCDLAQGFLFSKPVPAHKAMLMLESQRRQAG